MWSGGVTPGIWDNALRHASATKTTQVTTWLILFCMFFVTFLSVLCGFPKSGCWLWMAPRQDRRNGTVQGRDGLALLPCSEARLTGGVYQEDEAGMNSRLFRRAPIDRLCMNCALDRGVPFWYSWRHLLGSSSTQRN